MGVLLSVGRENVDSSTRNNTNNPNNESNNATNIPNSRLNLLYNQISNKNKKKKSRTDLFNVSFSTYFYIAGRRFKNLMTQAQNFLFGDQLDLSFILAHKPVVFPHDVPSLEAPSKYLQSLVNIRKDTIKLVKCVSETEGPIKYNIEFRFDCDCDVKIQIHYFATEKFMPNQPDPVTNQHLSYFCECSKHSSCCCLLKDEQNEDIIYAKGTNILFQRPEHFIIPDNYNFNNLQFNINSNYYPIVIECRPLSDKISPHHAHITLAYIDKTIINKTQQDNSGYSLQSLNINHSYQIKPIKQKQFIDGVLYSLQEIYGIEKKNSNDDEQTDHLCVSQTSSSIATSLTATTATNSNSTTTSTTTTSSSKRINQDVESLDSTFKDDESDEKKRGLEQEIEQELKGIECVICMCETRDTLILPCRHLCLCKLCAINLRIQSNNCPICRIPFIALVQIKLLRKKEDKNVPKPIDMTQLPVLRIENLNVLFNEENNVVSSPNENENGIIEENYHIKSETDNDNFIKKEILVTADPQQQNKKLKLLDLYETVSIYEAFNESDLQNIKLNENKNKKNRRSKKLNKQTPVPIETIETVQTGLTNLDEADVIISEPKVTLMSNILNTSFNKSKLPLQARSSSVLVGQSDSGIRPKSVRSASYVGNYNNGQQQTHETIQMGDI